MENRIRGMKAKTIKAVISKKINAWLESIENEAVRKMAADNTIVTGGCIASMLLGEPINDFDLYFRTKATAWAVANYYVGRFQPEKRKGIDCKIRVTDENDRIRIVVQSAGVASEEGTEKPYEYFESRPEGEAAEFLGEIMTDPGEIENTYEEVNEKALMDNEPDKLPYRPVFLSTNAITLSGRIQLILRFYGEPDQIHENYDFQHCTNYWISWDKQLLLRPGALEALLTRELVYVGSKYPVCSVFRLRKFLRRGWTINAGQILKDPNAGQRPRSPGCAYVARPAHRG